MKYALGVLVMVLCLLEWETLSWADQVRFVVIDMVECGGPGNNEKRMEACKDSCRDKSGNMDQYLSKGWEVVSQRPVVFEQKPFRTNVPGVPDTGWCKCRGAEYILSSPKQ